MGEVGREGLACCKTDTVLTEVGTVFAWTGVGAVFVWTIPWVGTAVMDRVVLGFRCILSACAVITLGKPLASDFDKAVVFNTVLLAVLLAP